MEEIGDYSFLNSRRTETHMLNQKEVENYNKDSHREVRDSLKKLTLWKEESQRDFSYINICIDKGINDLIDEVCSLQDELSVTRRERNDLIQTVSNLSGEIRKLSTRLNITEPIPHIVENDLDTIEEESFEMEVTDTDQQEIDKSGTSSESEDEENIDYGR